MAVTALDAADSGTTSTLTYSVSAGSNRVLVVAVGQENSSGHTAPNVGYGGEAMTRVVWETSGESGYTARADLFVLDDAGIEAASSSVITVTNIAEETVHARSFQGVDQTVMTGSIDSGSSTTTTPNPIQVSVTCQDGSAVVGFAEVGNTSTANWTSGDTTERTDQVAASSAGSLSDAEFSSGQTVNAYCQWSSQNRASSVVMELVEAAEGETFTPIVIVVQ